MIMNRTKKYFSVAISIMILSFLLMSIGCGSMPWDKKKEQPPVELLDETKSASTNGITETGTSLVPGQQRFKDVPLPDKVKEDFDRSYVYESGSLQVGRMVYSIRADINDIAQFYVKECQKYGWKLDNVIQGDGMQLNYSKEGKRLQVNIQPQGLGKPKRLILTLTPPE